MHPQGIDAVKIDQRGAFGVPQQQRKFTLEAACTNRGLLGLGLNAES